MFAVSSKRVLPGFTLSLGTSLLFVCLILLLPLSALVMQLAQMSWAQYWDVISNPQVMDKLKDKFPQTELFRVEDKFGSWPEVMKTHFVSGGELDKLLAAGRK